ncbi:MAG TPA: hypothetical protein VMC81_06255 [Rhodocyclaceae bacterium]|nr:hypothetical protein [Rhodocyclaceae bacterium]
MDDLQALQGLDLLPTPAYLVGVVVFGIIGIAAWRYGGKASNPPVRWIGLALMLYPYVVSNTAAMYAVGIALCGAAYWFHR